MTHTPHGLSVDFPDMAQKISVLKERDAHFAKLVADYDLINEQVHRAEARLEARSETVEEDLRKKRAALKDHIWQHLR